jgi:hypothetical protein
LKAYYNPLSAVTLIVMLSLSALVLQANPSIDLTTPQEIPGIDCPLDITVADVCPADASVSLEEGATIDAFTTWTVAGLPDGPLADCIGDECSDPGSLSFIVFNIDDDQSSCDRTISVSFLPSDACVNEGQPFTINYRFIDDTPPDAPTPPADITIECIKDIPFDSDLAAFDDCAGLIAVFAEDMDLGGTGCAGDPFIINRTWTFDDGCGNVTAVSQQIFVVDELAPTWTCVCANDTIYSQCPDEADISLEVGDILDIFSTWTVAGEEVPGLVGCVADNCTEPVDIRITVADITYDNTGCSQLIYATFVAEDECGNISEPFTCFYVVADDVPPVPPVVDDITVECILDIDLAEEDELTAFDECQGPITATATDTDNGGSGCSGDELIIDRTWTFDDGCGNIVSVTQQITVIIPDDYEPQDPGNWEPPIECGECDGGLTLLEVVYNGTVTGTLVARNNNNREIYYDGPLAPGQVITLTPVPGRQKLHSNVKFYIDGLIHADVHTSCSEPIYIGLTFGDFEVTNGESRNGGAFCPPPPPDPCACEEPPVNCEPCAGGTVLLEVQYNGAEAAGVRVLDGGHIYFNGAVNPGDIITLTPLPGQTRLRNNLDFFVDATLNAEIHTSCSEPIGPGQVAGDFLVTRAVSRVNGEMCPIGQDGGGGDDPDDPDETDCECAGGTTLLETVYHGLGAGNLVIRERNIVYYDGPVSAGDVITIVPLPGDNRLKNNLDYIIDGQLNGEVHTSCSVPIYVGLVFGDFEITAGESRNNGAFCEASGDISGMAAGNTAPTGNGTGLAGTSVSFETDALLTTQRQAQVYPNPFFERATITFRVEKAGAATLEIISPTGQVVEARDFGWLEAGQRQTFDFNAGSSYATGTYIYRIISGGSVMNGRMILMK